MQTYFTSEVELAGYIKEVETSRPAKKSELDNIYTEINYRSRGIGTSLVDEFVRWSKEKGAEVISVTALAKNERAIEFYERVGFTLHNATLEHII